MHCKQAFHILQLLPRRMDSDNHTSALHKSCSMLVHFFWPLEGILAQPICVCAYVYNIMKARRSSKPFGQQFPRRLAVRTDFRIGH